MAQPQRIRWTLSLAAGIVILALVAVAFMTSRREAPPQAPDPKGEEVAPAPPPAPVVPVVAPPLRRSDLVAAAARAAAAYAAGEAYPATDKALVGQQFEIVIPFGCSGPSASPSADPARWNFDLKKKTITLTAQPQLWTDTPWVRDMLGDSPFERIEGFWIPRPWLAAETCPAPRTPSPGGPAPAASEPTVGVVRVFSPDASRVGRRDERPYQVVRKAGEDELATTAHEYRLVLNGRVVGFPAGDAVRCGAASIDQRPICLIGVEIDRVAFVEPDSAEVLAEWRD